MDRRFSVGGKWRSVLRWRAGRLVLGAAFVTVFLGAPGGASAANHCGSTSLDDGTLIRVAALGTSCPPARKVAAGYFEHIQAGDRLERDGRGGAFFTSGGYRCYAGLGRNQAFCRGGARQRVYASILPEDDPGGWTRPGRRYAVTSDARKCKSFIFIGARGSGESVTKDTRGVGPSVHYLATQIEKRLRGRAMGLMPVVYRAESTRRLIPSAAEASSWAGKPLGVVIGLYLNRHVRPFTASINDGVDRTIEAVHAVLEGCPRTKLILGGYSQGAMAIHQAERKLEHQGDADALNAIKGTLLLGDGDRTPFTDAELTGGASRLTAGIRVSLHGLARPEDVQDPETTIEICATHDVICDFSPASVFRSLLASIKLGIQVHTSYLDNRQERAYLDQAVASLSRKMGL